MCTWGMVCKLSHDNLLMEQEVNFSELFHTMATIESSLFVVYLPTLSIIWIIYKPWAKISYDCVYINTYIDIAIKFVLKRKHLDIYIYVLSIRLTYCETKIHNKGEKN